MQNVTSSGRMTSVKAGCATNPSHPVSQAAACVNTAANPVVGGSLSPRCFGARDLTPFAASAGGLPNSNCSAPSVA